MSVEINSLREASPGVKVGQYRLVLAKGTRLDSRVKAYERVEALSASYPDIIELGEAGSLKGGLLEAFGWVLSRS